MRFRGEGVKGFAKGKAVVADSVGQFPEDLPSGCVLVVPKMTLEESLMVDFSKVSAIVTGQEDDTGAVRLLAVGMGIPVVTGIGDGILAIVSGDRIIINGLDVLVNPGLTETQEYESLRKYADPQLSLNLDEREEADGEPLLRGEDY